VRKLDAPKTCIDFRAYPPGFNCTTQVPASD
jgi:hypothetical protein